MRKLLLRTRGYGEIDAIARNHFGNLLRRALMQMQAYLRIFQPKGANHRRQHVARLGMCGGDRQSPAVGLAQLRGGAANILHFPQDTGGARNDFLAGAGGPGQRTALALEQLKAQFLLQKLELPADSGLRRVQLARGRGYVEAVFMDCHQIAQLLELHRRPALSLIGVRRIGYKFKPLRALRSGARRHHQNACPHAL